MKRISAFIDVFPVMKLSSWILKQSHITDKDRRALVREDRKVKQITRISQSRTGS